MSGEEFSLFNVNSEYFEQERIDKARANDLRVLLGKLSEIGYDERTERELEEEIRSHTALMLYETAISPYWGITPLRDPLSAFNYWDLLILKKQNHQCSSMICEFLHIPANMQYWDPYTRLPRQSSGRVWICRSTAQVHVCIGYCGAVMANSEDESGYICAISGQFKGQIYDEMPQGKDEKISRTRIDAINSGHKSQLQRNNYCPDEGESEEVSDYNDDGAPQQKRKRKKPQRGKGKSKKAKESDKPEANPEEPESSESESSSHQQQDWMDADQTSAALQAQSGFDLHTMPGIPKGSAEVARRSRAAPTWSAHRAVFDLPSDPEERTVHFMRNPEQRALVVMDLLEELMTHNSAVSLWEHYMARESERAGAKFESFVRKHRNAHLTMFDEYLHWLSHMITYGLPVPQKPKEHFSLDPYQNIILRAWEIVAHSPYARNADQTRIVPNLVNIAQGILYTIIDGPLPFECSIPESVLAEIPAELDALDLRSFFVVVLPDGREDLTPRLAKREHLKMLTKLTRKKFRFSVKKKAKGIRCFRDAVNSSIEHYRDELQATLKAGTVPVVEAVLDYVDRCWGLKCALSYEQT